MALAFGMAQTVLPNLKIEQPSVVAKSFPNFWNEISKFKNSVKKMTIIGDPVEHSLTPLLYNSAFAELGINFVCEKCPISREKIHEFLKNNPYEKLAITAPHKKIAAEFVALNSNHEKQTKFPPDKGVRGFLQINSLRYDGKIRGKNTDIPGIREVLNGDLKNGQTVLILGAGDTATSVLEALKIYDLKIFVHNRTPEKAQNLAKKFGISAISDLMKIQPEILISALPFDCEPELVEKMWKTLETVFVVGYNGLKVPRILQKACEKKKEIRTGGDLLWAQWKLQFEFLFDLPAPLDGKNLLKSFTNLTK
jgi:shikimate 5-dehydrogenase